MGAQLEQLSTSMGVSLSQIKLVALLFLSVPLSLVFPYLPSSATSSLPHIFAAAPSFFFLWTVLELRWGFLQLLASSLATWVLVKQGVNQGQGKSMPWRVFSVVMGHLTINHILRHFSKVPVTSIEITGSQMVLCMKLTSFAWSVYDGQRPIADLDVTQRASRIEKVPGLIPFLGYCFFFPSILAGPSFTYASYANFTSRALFRKETALEGAKEVSTIPPGRRRKATKRFLTGVAFLGIYAMYGGKGDYKNMVAKGFSERSFGYRFAFMNFAGFMARAKYYSVWCIAESAFILSGIGYNPLTTKYDASRNVRIRSIEFAPNFKVLFDSWNCGTNVWLRESIYKRVSRQGKKPGFKSTQATFITSALWHGVNPCYLLTFICGGFAQSLNRSLRSLVRPFFLPPNSTHPPAPPSHSSAPPTKPHRPPQTPAKWAYDLAGILSTQLVLNFLVAPFLLLEMRASILAWASVYFYGLWMVFLPIAILHFGGAKWLRGLLKKRDARHLEKGEREKNEREEVGRREWEEAVEEKRRLRGEGVASLGLDVEELVEEEMGNAKSE